MTGGEKNMIREHLDARVARQDDHARFAGVEKIAEL
jgi:hypothetical protein